MATRNREQEQARMIQKQQQEREQQQHEQNLQNEHEQWQNIDNMINVIAAWNKGKDKQKKTSLHRLLSGIRMCKKSSKDTMLFGMETIVNWFGDGWHKSIMDLFAVQRFGALFGNSWHK